MMSKYLAALTLIAGLASLGSPASAACPGQEFVGQFDFTTRVTGAKSKKAIGVNGYYRMRVAMLQGCAIQVSVVKLGFNKIMFSRDKLQWGTFPARSYEVPNSGDGGKVSALFVDASLRSNAGNTLDMAITLLSGVSFGFPNGSGAGFWRHLGASWESAGMWGGLQWASSAENGPYAATSKPDCSAQIAQSASGTVAAFSCDGFFVANNELSQTVVARAAGTESPYSYGKIADSGSFTEGGFWWDVCVNSESENGGHNEPWVERVGYLPGRTLPTLAPAASSWKRCGARAPKPEAAPAPRWNGGIR